MLPVVEELLNQGLAKADIARELGQSKATIGNWVKRLEIK
ncbi:terminase gpP N-terminus-related DNA-binding protein [Klebsiella pneumoniae]